MSVNFSVVRSDNRLCAFRRLSTAGVQRLQQRDARPAGAAAERAQCRVAAGELLPGRHQAQD